MGRGTIDDCPVLDACGTIDQPEHPATVTNYYLDAVRGNGRQVSQVLQ
jgi:hypothetical protein